MNTGTKLVLSFVAGGAVGSLITYYAVRETFRNQAEEEIQSVRDIYLKREAKELEEFRVSQGVETVTEEDLVQYHLRGLAELGYEIPEVDDTNYDEVNPVEYPEGVEEIDESEFMNGFEDYESSTLTLYTDGVMTDDIEDVVDDPKRYFNNIDLESYEKGDDLYFVNHTLMLKIELIVSKQSYKRDVLGEDDEELGDFADKANN